MNSWGKFDRTLARSNKEFERKKREYNEDLDELTALLKQAISQYSASGDIGDRQMAEIYAKELASLSDPELNYGYATLKRFRAGQIPGIQSRRRSPNMPPAWS